MGSNSGFGSARNSSSITRQPASAARARLEGAPEASPGACQALEKELSDLQRSRLVARELLGAEQRFRAGGTP